MAGEYALYNFSPLKFVENCFMAQKIVSFSECSMCVEKSVYSPVLLIMSLKHIFLLEKKEGGKRKGFC